jgi:hypothetical protein
MPLIPHASSSLFSIPSSDSTGLELHLPGLYLEPPLPLLDFRFPPRKYCLQPLLLQAVCSFFGSGGTGA